MSAAARKRIGDAQRKRWAAQKEGHSLMWLHNQPVGFYLFNGRFNFLTDTAQS